jgi:hypothetical protein
MASSRGILNIQSLNELTSEKGKNPQATTCEKNDDDSMFDVVVDHQFDYTLN